MDIEKRLYLRLFSFCIGRVMEILSFFIDTCVLNHSDFDSFLDLLQNRHQLFHKWLSKTPCCECINSVSIATPNKGSVLNEAQLKTIYKLDGTEVAGHVTTNNKGHVIQHCLCKVSAIAGITTDNLDIALVHCLLKTCDPVAFSKVGTHIEVIRGVRNDLAHPSQRGIMTEFDFSSKWNDVENAVLAIAKEVSTSYERHAKKLIFPLRNMDVKLEDIVEKCDSLEENIKGKLTEILQEHKKRNDVIEHKAENIKKEIIKALEKQKDELSIEIRQLTFAVRLHGIEIETMQDGSEYSGRKDEDSKHLHCSDEKSQQKQSGETHTDRCKVTWRLETPGAWDVEQIKQTLERVSALLSPFFSIEFIYAGSLVIQTSVSRHILRDRQLLISAIQLFLEKIVEVCEINTDVKQTVTTDFSVLDLNIDEAVKAAVEVLVNLPKISETETNSEEDQVRCKPFNQPFTCDQCTDRRKQNLVLEEENKRMVETIADMKMELLKLESEDIDYHRLLQKPKYIDDTEQGVSPTDAKMEEGDSISLSKTVRPTQPIKEDTTYTISSANKQCQLCITNPNPAVYWCTECEQFICRDCNIVHRTQPTSSAHTTVLTSCDYTYQIQGIHIGDIASLCEGELIISDFKGKQLIKCDIKGQNKQFISLLDIPWRLTVIDIHNVAVTTDDNKKVLIVDVKNKTVTQQIDIKRLCRGIVYKNNNLYVGCYDYSLVVLDMSGEVNRTVPLSFTPWYICSGTERRMYCTDDFSDNVYCIDTEGNTVFTVTNPDMSDNDTEGNTVFTVTNPDISAPTGITTDNEGRVLVVCYLSNNVHRISPDGKQCNVIITGIPSSSGLPYLCYDSVSESVVIGCGDNIYVYKI